MNCSYPGTVDLERALEHLANNDQACKLIDVEFSGRGIKNVGASFRSKSIPPAIREEIEEFLEESLINCAETVWSGNALNDEDDEDYGDYENTSNTWPVDVQAFCGLYFVFSPEHEMVGYFLSAEDAVQWCLLNWDNLEGDYVKPKGSRSYRNSTAKRSD